MISSISKLKKLSNRVNGLHEIKSLNLEKRKKRSTEGLTGDTELYNYAETCDSGMRAFRLPGMLGQVNKNRAQSEMSLVQTKCTKQGDTKFEHHS